jgi:hypothetical protein
VQDAPVPEQKPPCVRRDDVPERRDPVASRHGVPSYVTILPAPVSA